MKLYVIMIVCNCLKYTLQTVESIKTNIPYKFVIIDNASRDDTPKWLDEYAKQPHIIPIRHSEHRCVAASWNEGLRKALEDPEFEYALMLSNDVVLEPYYIDGLIKFLQEHVEYSAVSGMDTHTSKKQESGVTEGTVFWAAYLIRKDCILKVGFFDENFIEAYFEDNDYHERIKRANLRTCIINRLGFYHHGSRWLYEGATQQEVDAHHAYFRQNREYFKKKWGFIP